jgi:hypothetical protein
MFRTLVLRVAAPLGFRVAAYLGFGGTALGSYSPRLRRTIECPHCADAPGNRAVSLNPACSASLRPLLFAIFGNHPREASLNAEFFFFAAQATQQSHMRDVA